MSLFHCESMQHVSLFMSFDDAPMASIHLAESGFFDPSRAHSQDNRFPDKQGIAYRRIYNNALSDWEKTSHYLMLTPTEKVNRLVSINKHKLLSVENRINKIWKTCTEHKEKKHLLDEQLNSLKQLFSLLDHFIALDINLSLLQQGFQFLDVRLGIIPLAYISRLKQALAIEGYYLSIYIQHENTAHVIIAGIKTENNSIQALLDSASFQSLHIPDEFHQHPQDIYTSLQQKRQKLKLQSNELEQQWSKLQNDFKQEMVELGNVLTLAKPYATLSLNMLRKGQLIEINGWVPSTQVALIKTQLDQHIANPVIILTREPKPEEYAKTPSYLLRPDWLQPFLKLVTHYGIPGYREFDPSWFFTLSYILMFGIMFGDVGHGACIIALSVLFKQGVINKKMTTFAPFFFSTGLSSMLFGFFYGSIFSYEHVLPALWLSPMDDPMLMLTLALVWGICFIIVHCPA